MKSWLILFTTHESAVNCVFMTLMFVTLVVRMVFYNGYNKKVRSKILKKCNDIKLILLPPQNNTQPTQVEINKWYIDLFTVLQCED